MYSLGLGVLGFWVLRLSAFGFRALASLGFRVQGVVCLGFLGLRFRYSYVQFKVLGCRCRVQGVVGQRILRFRVHGLAALRA